MRMFQSIAGKDRARTDATVEEAAGFELRQRRMITVDLAALVNDFAVPL
jgi:hypothetical protein